MGIGEEVTFRMTSTEKTKRISQQGQYSLRIKLNIQIKLSRILCSVRFQILLFSKSILVLWILTPTISRGVLITMIKRKIREDHQAHISLKYANSYSKVKNALMVNLAQRLITEQKSFITLTSTKLSSVLPSLPLLTESKQNVSTAISAHSLIQSLRSQWSLLTNSKKTQIFTCSISRRYGALTTRQTTNEISVFILIIGRTSVENLSYTITQRTNALIGVRDLSLTATKMGVRVNILASSVMVGKSRSTIPKTTSSTLVSTENPAISLIALTTIAKVTGDSLQHNGSRYSPAQEQ